MSVPYKTTQEIINKCTGYSNTNIINPSYYKKILETKDYYNGGNIDCIELQALYMSVLKKHMILDNVTYKKSRY
jgi:hypothetical protein